MKTIKILFFNIIEIIIGGLILVSTDDVRWFLFYFFIIFIVSSELRKDYIRKLIRVYQVANEGKLLGIIRKLGITSEDLQNLGDEIESKLTKKQKKSLYKDMDEMGLK